MRWPWEFDWLAPGDIPADPLADFANTTENCLSVWFVDDDKQNLDDILAALAASREKADKLDYVLFAQEHLAVAGIDVHETPGDTPDESVNRHHRDLGPLSAAKVLALTTRVWQANLGLHRVHEVNIAQPIAEAVRNGPIAIERLRPKLKEDVRRYLEKHRDDHPKAT